MKSQNFYSPSFRLNLILVLFFALSIQFGMVAQSNMTSISAQDAATEVSLQQSSFGYSQVFFGATDLNRLLADPSITAMRFYTAETADPSFRTILAVGVNSNNSEAGFYIRMDGPTTTTFLTAGEARADVQRSKDGTFSTVATTVTRADLTSYLESTGANGIHLKPGKSGENDSMIISPAQSNGFTSFDTGTGFFRDDAPCPNNCGDGFLIDMN